jgi:putative peptidoglycan lipid II flippase
MHAALVAAGILLSRVMGLVRESLKARYLGATDGVVADAFYAAFRIPNLLQNLFGEGALSASFIPVYSDLVARGKREEADGLAGAIGALLALLTAVLVLIGVWSAPVLVSLIASGFEGERRELTITLTRILFPGAALFAMSAWCLGILNSHRRFFVSYAAPVAWNGAMIAVLVVFRDREPGEIVLKVAWASVAGAGLQFLVQLPVVLRVAPALRASLGRANAHVREVVRNFVPAFFSRGVVQISGYVDQLIASFLPIGAVALLGYAQTISMIPISLFGIAISAAELPEMSSAPDAESAALHIRKRLQDSLTRMSFFVVPSAIALLLLGDVIAGGLYQHGRFTAADTRYTWGILAAASLGLMASTRGRLYSSAFFALRDTRTPLRFAIIRVLLAGAGGWAGSRFLPGALGVSAMWGAAALALSSAVAGWVEFLLLRSRLSKRIGDASVPLSQTLTLWVVAAVAGAAAVGVKAGIGDAHRILVAVAVLGTFGAAYVGLTAAFGVETARTSLRRIRSLIQ